MYFGLSVTDDELKPKACWSFSKISLFTIDFRAVILWKQIAENGPKRKNKHQNH